MAITPHSKLAGLFAPDVTVINVLLSLTLSLALLVIHRKKLLCRRTFMIKWRRMPETFSSLG